MIVKDELNNLPACLRSLAGYVDEIVIVDTGSTDGTQYLVKAWQKACGDQCPVITGEFEWINDFSAARNYAMSLATGDWFFTVDADDRIDVDDWPQMLKFLRSENDLLGEYDMVACRILNVYGNKATIGTQLIQPRFFRRSSGPKYEMPVHNNITFPDLGRPHNAIVADFKIYHTGYGMITEDEQVKKGERVVGMTKKHTEENPDSAYGWMNYGNALKSEMARTGRTNDLVNEAHAALDNAMRLAGTKENHTFINAVTLKGWLHFHDHEFDKAIVCAEAALKHKRDHIDAILLKGYACADSDKLDDAEFWLKQYLIEHDKVTDFSRYDYVVSEWLGHKADVYLALAAIERRRNDVIDRRRALMIQ